jgi:hypothetical protein
LAQVRTYVRSSLEQQKKVAAVFYIDTDDINNYKTSPTCTLRTRQENSFPWEATQRVSKQVFIPL